MSDVHIIIGETGEYSSRTDWIAGVFTNLDDARATAGRFKVKDRENWTMWSAWNTAHYIIGTERMLTWDHRATSWQGMTRDTAGVDFGIGPEPPSGSHESEYTVVSVPVDRPGRWDILFQEEAR